MKIAISLCLLALGQVSAVIGDEPSSVRKDITADDVFAGLREFYRQTARVDGSFQPGVDPEYQGMSDCAYSDLAAVTYAVTLHKTFGWRLPYADQTADFLLSRQNPSGEFYNVAGTVDPASAQGRVYNTTQGIVALRALGLKPRFDPLPIFDDVLRQDYKTLPAYATSFFPLAYLASGSPIPPEADRKIRSTMLQGDDGYLNDHIAATFHAAHYYGLIGQSTPKAALMLARILREQKSDGSWLLNQPARDRHATYDAIFTLHHLGHNRADCRAAIERAARWALSCRNADGGFGHFPGSTSDADANYFHAGTLVLAGFLPPVRPLPRDPHLLSWGHLMPVPAEESGHMTLTLPAWTGAVAFSPDGKRLATGSGDGSAWIWNLETGTLVKELSNPLKNARASSSAAEVHNPSRAHSAHENCIVSAAFAPDGRRLATASLDHTARLWDTETNKLLADLVGHRGAVMSIAFDPNGRIVATGSIDGTVKLWEAAQGKLNATLTGHTSWVNSVKIHPAGRWLASGSSDGTIRVWDLEDSGAAVRILPATKAEVRSVAFSPDGQRLAAGMRYGLIKIWDTQSWQEQHAIAGHEEDVWSIAFTPDSGTLVSGNGAWNQPGQVKLWDAATGRQRGTLPQSGEVLSLAVSPDGKLIAAGCRDGTVSIAPIRLDR